MISIFKIIDGELKISGEFAFYMFSVHGIPPEYLEINVNKWLSNNNNFNKFLGAIK